MGFISWLISVVYRTFFLKGDTGFKTAHWAVKVVHILLVAVVLASGDTRLLAGLALSLVILGFISPGREWVASTLALSTIVSLYMSLTALLGSLVGLAPVSVEDAVVIGVKTLTVSISIAFTFTLISPLEISALLVKLGARRAGSFPLLTWRLIPYGLKSFVESLQIGYVKGEKTSSRIPPAVASILEIGGFIEEYCFHKLNIGARHAVLPQYSAKYSSILFAYDVIMSLLLIAKI